MYQPPQFRTDDVRLAAAVMREHPFASLITLDDEGFPHVTHLPMHLEETEGRLVLLGHCARPNAQWRHLLARPQALVTFLGPHAYVTPKVYPDLKRVPTWNYVAVHCRVTARIVDDPLAKDRLLKKLIGDHEPPYAEQWRGLGEEFAHKMLAGIVAFELDVMNWQCTLKLSQHRPESHAKLREIYAAGNDHQRALAGWMDRLGMGGH